MPTLENNRLVFRFPQLEADASFSIDFQRTLRIPDSDQTYSLPPGFGSFPLRHVEDYASKLPAQTASRGGVMLPMWQAEALWLNFQNRGPQRGLRFPVAIKVAAGKINAITGESWRPGLHRDPQDYMVSPEQPWLDGFAIEKGVIRQFVAMPLGGGFTAEEQLTGTADIGGLQISVAPLKPAVWKERRKAWEREQASREEAAPVALAQMRSMPLGSALSMGLAAGGRMRQSVYPDPFELEDWDFDSADRVFVSLVHAQGWKALTGEPAPNQPPTSKDYTAAGLPWFEYYGLDQDSLNGSSTLARLRSVGNLFRQMTGAKLPHSEDVHTGRPVKLGPGAQPRPVRTAGDC